MEDKAAMGPTRQSGVEKALSCCCTFVTTLSVFTTMGGFVFGYDIGVIGGVKDMCPFREHFGNQVKSSCNLSNKSHGCPVVGMSRDYEWSIGEAEQGLIVGSFSLGCLAGALMAGVLSETVGRKRTILVGAIVFTVGGATQGAAFYLWMVYLGRVVAGWGVGILSMVVPVYIAEVAPPSARGRLVSVNQLSITAGIMVSFLVNLASEPFSNGWRFSLFLQCLFSLILFFGMIYFPETPRYLMKVGRRADAARVLVWIRTGRRQKTIDENDTKGIIGDEIEEISAVLEETRTAGEVNWKEIVQKENLKRLILGMLVQLFQQFTGMNVIMYYSTGIFSKVGVEAFVATAVVGIINFVTTFGTLVLVDRFGRKSLLLGGGIGMALSVALGGVVILVSGDNFSSDSCNKDQLSKLQGGLVVLFVCSFVFSFALTWGPVAWVVTSEIFPLRVRGKCVSVTTASNWLGNFSIAYGTPMLLSGLGVQGTFFLMAALNTAATVFVLISLPETKGLSLEQVDKMFTGRSLLDVSDYRYYLRCGCCCKKSPTSRRLWFNIDDDAADKISYDADEEPLLSDQEQTTTL